MGPWSFFHFLYFQNVFYDPNPSNLPQNRFIECSLILSSSTLKLLNFASRAIQPQCCMPHLLQSQVLIREGGGWGTRPQLSEFSGSAPGFK